MKSLYTLLLGISLSTIACEKPYDTERNPIVYGDTYLKIDINTDKAVYQPNATVHFTLGKMPQGAYKVRYSYLGETIKEEPLTGTSWTWKVPSDNYRGYLVEVYKNEEGREDTYGSIAVDVSTDWTAFPRYGFLSSYDEMSEAEINSNIAFLSRCHINGLQFYDWMYQHHRPLASTPVWDDLFKRKTYLKTIKSYITAAHKKGIKAMFYNLAFGVLGENAAADGVQDSWYLYKDKDHKERDKHALDKNYATGDIYLVNPANTAWQSYIAGRNNDVYAALDFDGYHIDQLGGRGNLYDYDGKAVDLLQTYAPFINAMKSARPDKHLVMNAVGQYGQKEIATTNVDFLYTEVWDAQKTYEQLVSVIKENDQLSNNNKRTVLAAYMNYNRAKSIGYVNEPGILLADAVIFSNGGAHLELGEHYLTREYFPDKNLVLCGTLKKHLITYYDFLVGYQNLLRGGATLTSKNITAVEGATLAAGLNAAGKVNYTVRELGDKEIWHLVNFTGVDNMEWRDTNATQVAPDELKTIKLTASTTKPVKKVWFASPDIYGGAPRKIEFTQENNQITLTLPYLKYWDMVVIEY